MPGAPHVVMLRDMTLAFDNAYEGVPELGDRAGCSPSSSGWSRAARSPAPSSMPAAARGWAAVRVAADGHEVVGIDVAARAVELARQLAAGGGCDGDVRGRRRARARDRHRGRLRGRSTPCSTWACSTRSSPPTTGGMPRPWHRSSGPGGTALVVAWSDRNPFGYGPERVTRRAIRAAFGRASGWRVESIEEEQLESRLGTGVVHAWLAIARRR